MLSMKKRINTKYDSKSFFDIFNQKISLGYGQKLTYKTEKADEDIPGPIYQSDYYQSIKMIVDKTEPRRNSTFGCDKDQQSKVMYSG